MDKFRRKVQINGPLTVGYSDTGYDVTLYSATAGCNLLWDESTDELDISATTEIQAAHKLQFRDSDIYINSTADAGLNLVADGAITLTAPSVIVAGQFSATGSTAFTGSQIFSATACFAENIAVAGSTSLVGPVTIAGSSVLSSTASLIENLEVTGCTSLTTTQVGDGTNYTTFASDGLMTMAATARVIKSYWIPPIDIRANTNKNWTAGSNANASSFAHQFGSSGTEGSAQVGFAVPTDMDTTATGSVDVLWSAGCVAAANASMAITVAYYGIGEGGTPDPETLLTGVEGSGTGGASAFEYTNVTDALTAPAASTRHMTIRLTFNPNTAESSAGSTFQLNGMTLKYISNKLGTAT